MECTMERLNVDKGLLPFKGTYFCMLAGTASLIPYIEVYMKMLGLTLTETAIICGTIPFIHGVTRTIIGGLADKMNAHKSVFMLLCLITAISYGCMVFVPQRTTPEAGHRTVHVELHCWTNGAHFFVCNGGSSTVDADIEGESHGSVAARYISFNASVCRWTCSVEEQHSNTNHTETMLFIRPNQTDCLTVNQTATFEIGLGKLQRTTAENCGALTSPITDNGFCSCYTLQSFVVHDDTCEGMQCEKPTRLICKADCVHKKDVSIGGLGLHNDSRGLSPSDRTGIHFGWVFWSVAILYFLGQLTQQPLFGLNDAMLYTFLGDKRNTWGKQRLWGTIGFAVFGPISGLLMDNCSLGQNEYTVAFLLFVVFMLLTVFCACQHNVSSRRVTCSPQVFKDIVGLIRRPEAFVLFTLVLVFGMFMGVISTFLFWYLKLLRDVPQILFGLCILCSCSMEVFVLFFSDRVFRLISQVNCFSIACVVYAIRLASYSVIRNPWMVLIVEPLHAITFGLMYAAASTYVSSITPPGAHGSVQNIIASLHFCYGKSLGALLGGVLFERYGGVATFRMFAVSSLVLLVLHLIAQKFWVKGGRTVNVIEMEVKREQLSTEPGDDEYVKKKMTAPGEESPRVKDETKHEETVYDGLV